MRLKETEGGDLCRGRYGGHDFVVSEQSWHEVRQPSSPHVADGHTNIDAQRNSSCKVVENGSKAEKECLEPISYSSLSAREPLHFLFNVYECIVENG